MAAVTADQVTPCLVTRGDQPEMMERILDSLIFDTPVVWDNSRFKDMKTAGRYCALPFARHDIVYFQDDDVLVPRETQEALLAAYEPGVMVASYGHGETSDGYDDMPLLHGGAIVDRDLPWQALDRYLAHYPADEDFRYEADFVAGILYPAFKHLHLPFEINLAVAQHPSRMCNQPWQRDLKYDITQRARAIRDGMMVAA